MTTAQSFELQDSSATDSRLVQRQNTIDLVLDTLARRDVRRAPLFVKITGYRLLSTILIAAFGIPKAVEAYRGNASATTIEWVSGVALGILMYWIGHLEAVNPPVLPWFFHEDYATFVVLPIQAFFAMPPTPPKDIHAQLLEMRTRLGENVALRVHFSASAQERLASVVDKITPEMRHLRPGELAIHLDTEENSNLGIDLEGGEVVFRVLDPLVTGFGWMRTYQCRDPQATARIYRDICLAATFYYYLLHMPARPILRAKVEIEIRETVPTGDLDDDLNAVFKCRGPNLVNAYGKMHVTDRIILYYGIKITNKDPETDMHALFFFFDTGSLLIQYILFRSRSHEATDALPLRRAGGSITIGWRDGDRSSGAANRPLLSFSPLGGGYEGVKGAYCKLFLSTTPFDPVLAKRMRMVNERIGVRPGEFPRVRDAVTIAV